MLNVSYLCVNGRDMSILNCSISCTSFACQPLFFVYKRALSPQKVHPRFGWNLTFCYVLAD